MKNKFIAISSIMLFIILICLVPNCLATDSSTIVEFKDESVKEYFVNGTYRKEGIDEETGYTVTTSCPMDENGDGEISILELSKIETIYLNQYTITDYSFLQYCDNLKELQLCYNEIEDISFLETLTGLESLYLIENNISDVSKLKSLTSLEELFLGSNNITDISVISNLTNLKMINCVNNKIKTIPDLSKITAFNDIDVFNQYGYYNCYANFNQNEITDISGLKNTVLYNVYLYGNKVSDISVLSTMSNLHSVSLSCNEITDISSLPATVTSLAADNNKITDISSIEKLAELQYLQLSYNQITDASVLSKLTTLQSIYMDSNQLEELSLSNLETLMYVSCMNNNLEKITLENLPKLTSLSLNNNNISDISKLTGLDKVFSLNLSTNPISDISPISNTTATYIYLVDTLVNPYDEATFHIMCTWKENGQVLYLGDYSQFVPSNEEIYTTEEIEEVTVDGEEITVMPVDASTGIDELLTESSFPVIDTYTIKVLDASGEEKDTTEKIGSRNVIQILDENNEVLVEYVVVVKGDVTGNGYSKIYDAFKILKDILMPGVELDAIDTMIRDYNDDGLVRMYDSFQFLKASILG